DTYWNEGVARRLRVHERLRMHLVHQGRLDLLTDVLEFIRDKKHATVVVNDHTRTVYLAYPHFRDKAAGIPDEVFDGTGEVPAKLLPPKSPAPPPRPRRPRRFARPRRVARKVLGRRLCKA